MKNNLVKLIFLSLILTTSSYAGWRDKLNEAKDAAANKYTQSKEAVIEKKQSFSDAVERKKEEFTSSVTKKKQEKKDEAIEKLEQKMIELHDSLIEIHKIGFVADEVRVVSGFPPHAEVFFSDTGSTGREKEIILKNRHKKILSRTLKLLRDTRKIQVAHYEIKRVKIDFVIPPRITLITNVDLD